MTFQELQPRITSITTNQTLSRDEKLQAICRHNPGMLVHVKFACVKEAYLYYPNGACICRIFHLSGGVAARFRSGVWLQY
jgi:hypothetical protein